MKMFSLHATMSVAYKEFLHIYRDRRILFLLIILPPLFILLFGHAFEGNQASDIPALLIVRDQSLQTDHFLDVITKNKTFAWRRAGPDVTNESDLLGNHVKASLVIPAGWGGSLVKGNPEPLPLHLDGSDINTADAVEG